MPTTEVQVFRESANSRSLVETWLEQLEVSEPVAHQRCLQRILALATFGFELRRPVADFLRDGIYELRTKVGRVQYRILYFFNGRNTAVLSHGLTKEGKVPDTDIDRAIKHRQLVQHNPNKHIAEWDIDDGTH